MCAASSRLHLDKRGAAYWGVLAASADDRLIITARGGSYIYQSWNGHFWEDVRAFPMASVASAYVGAVVVDPSSAVLDVLRHLPDDPADCDVKTVRAAALS